jgi:hypothetical protein
MQTLALALLLLSAADAGKPSVWTEAERQSLIQGLDRTRDLLVQATANLGPEQWRFKEEPGRWSIAEVVEHLGLQEDMYFREVYLIAQQPALPRYRRPVKGNDEKILAYATDPDKAQAGWFLEPQGRWADPARGMASFLRSRAKLTEWVRTTPADLRVHFTFREYKGKANLWSVRDLHQLLLTTIAHTERHLNQILKVKTHAGYPAKLAAAPAGR